MTLLTTIEPVERYTLDDAVLAIEWSATDRTIALAADGRALVIGADRLTAPIGPDPIACAWITADLVAVVDGLLGVVVAGRGPTGVVAHTGTIDVVAPSHHANETIARQHYVVIAGRDGVSVVRADSQRVGQPSTIDTGSVRTVVHLGGTIWLAGGADGLIVVDVSLGCIDQRVKLPSIVALAAAPAVDRVAAADASGAIHIFEMADLERGTELTGYPDAVRRLGIDPTGRVIVAAADDELTWWSVDDDGRVVDEPDASVGHDAPITTCAIGAGGFVATGDRHGLVRLWSPRLRDLPLAELPQDDEITVLSWNQRGDRLAIGTTGGKVIIADIAIGDLL